MALSAIDSEQITVAGTAIGFTDGTGYNRSDGKNVVRAVCFVEDASIRVNTVNTPTAGGSEGSPLKDPGESFIVSGGEDLVKFRAIRETGTSGTLTVIYEGTQS